MADPSWTTPRPLILNPRERPRPLAKLSGNAPEYMGISSDLPGWRPRRSSYEDRRGAVGVTPSEVNTLVPYIPPIDTSSPPPSREWLDAMAKRFLAGAHADFEDSHRNATNDVTSTGPSLKSDDSTFFDYDTDSTLDGALTASRTPMPQPPQQAPQVEFESNVHDAAFDSTSDTDTDPDTDTDTDMNSDDGYNWSTTRTSESGPGSRWMIPRKRPSVVIVNKDVAINVDDSNEVSHGTSPSSGWGDPVSPLSSDDELGKRRRGGKTAFPQRVTKKPKRHANDTPVRQCRKSIAAHHTSEYDNDNSSERASPLPPGRISPPPGNDTPTSSRPPVSSVTAAALQMKQVRIASPGIASPRLLPQPNIVPALPKLPKTFPCLIDGCTQVCASAGDLQRHQLSLRHRAPSHSCLACGKSYTRSDALKRHLNSKASCKRVHATKMANSAEVEEVPAEANDEAVQVVAIFS
jgi:hypothetical protein